MWVGRPLAECGKKYGPRLVPLATFLLSIYYTARSEDLNEWHGAALELDPAGQVRDFMVPPIPDPPDNDSHALRYRPRE